MNYERIRYGIRDFVFKIRYKVILKLIGKMPVIVNCTVYDDVMEKNLGKTRTYKQCIGFNNKIRSFGKAVNLEIERRMVYTGNKGQVLRNGNAFSLYAPEEEVIVL